MLPPPAPRGDRRSSIIDFAISRLRRSWVLQGCAALAFLEYGALVVLAAFGATLRPDLFRAPKHDTGGNFALAGWLALCSLGSWFFLFLWFPFLRTLTSGKPSDASALTMGRVLESIAIGCVAFVHVMLAAVLASVL